jgi:hypothetical protein
MRRRPKPAPHIIRRYLNIRDYKFSAHLSRATGKLLKIHAGCRTWLSFADALEHYTGGGKYAPTKYSAAHFTTLQESMAGNDRWRDTLRTYTRERAEQLECQLLLGKLERDVAKWQERWCRRHNIRWRKRWR